jgi:hypothetical protein
MTKVMSLFVAAGICAAASLQAAPKCKFHDKETVIMDNNHPARERAWVGVPYVDPEPGGGIQGQNDPWSLVGFVATRVGLEDDYSFGDGKWSVGATGDFDGDGDCDLAWFRSVGGQTRMAVTLTPNDNPRFQEPVDDVTPWVALGSREIVGSGHFLNAAGTDVELATDAEAKADLVLWSATGGLVVWTDAEHLGGERTVTNTGAAGARAVAVADIVRPSGNVMPEVIWRNGDLPPLSYSVIVRQPSGQLDAGGVQHGLLSPGDFNWRLRGAGDFNGDGWDDLLFQNLPNSERTVIWMMEDGARLAGSFTNPDLLVFDAGRGVLAGQPRVIVAPR